MFCRSKTTNIVTNPEYLRSNFYGHAKKSISEDMVCFQQAACAYLKYYKSHNIQELWKTNQLNPNKEFDSTLQRF